MDISRVINRDLVVPDSVKTPPAVHTSPTILTPPTARPQPLPPSPAIGPPKALNRLPHSPADPTIPPAKRSRREKSQVGSIRDGTGAGEFNGAGERMGRDATSDGEVIAAASDASARSPYTELQKAVQEALESTQHGLTTNDKVALALEVLRARQLELDLAQARRNIEALVARKGSAPKTLTSVISASMVKGLPVGTPVDITKGKFSLAPSMKDPDCFLLTLDLQGLGTEVANAQSSNVEQGRSMVGNLPSPLTPASTSIQLPPITAPSPGAHVQHQS